MKPTTQSIVSTICMPLTLLAATCGRTRAPAADVVAVVAGNAVPYVEFEAYLATNAIADAPSLDGQVLSTLFDQFLAELLLTRMAAEEGVEAGGRQAAVAELIAGASPDIERNEIDAFYEAHRDRFRQPERVRVRQILVQERATAEAAVGELARDIPFEQVARELSQGPRAEMGGDQGVLSRDDLPPEIAKRIFDLATGEVSEIVAADYGFHIFEISERYPVTEISLELAVPEIIEELQAARREETTQRLLGRAAKRYNMKIYTRNLPFQYQGKYG